MQNENDQDLAEFQTLSAEAEPPGWFRQRDLETRQAFFYSRRFVRNNPYRAYVYRTLRRISNVRQLEIDLRENAMIIRLQYLQYRSMRNRFAELVRCILIRERNSSRTNS